MQYCPERKLRWNAYTASVSRGSRDTDVYLNCSGHVKVGLLRHCTCAGYRTPALEGACVWQCTLSMVRFYIVCFR